MKSQENILQELRLRRRQLIKDKNWSGALEVINTAITIEPTFDRYYNQGVVLLQLQRTKEAIQSFQMSLKLNQGFEKGVKALEKAKQILQNHSIEQIPKLKNSTTPNSHENQKTENISRETIGVGRNETPPKQLVIKNYKESKIPPLPEYENVSRNTSTERREKHILEGDPQMTIDLDANKVVESKKEEDQYKNSEIPPLPQDSKKDEVVSDVQLPNTNKEQLLKTIDFDMDIYVKGQSETTICENALPPQVINPQQIDQRVIVTKKYENDKADFTISIEQPLQDNLDKVTNDVHEEPHDPEAKEKTHTYFNDNFINPDKLDS
ncbi:hypothetical protein [Candidatus Uabimicrobium sp. HlEnr_7]|uniref:hypothetical protein n=1 Tax=Candidatus Uabimicrobium helgolandensis TaxID=3095367 RepID=UPI003558173A